MKLLNLFRRSGMERGLQAYRETPGAILLDVRTSWEYDQGHIPGSQNIPLMSLSDMPEKIEDKETALFVYCQSGNRSRQAVGILEYMGYHNAFDIGGIADYSGELVTK